MNKLVKQLFLLTCTILFHGCFAGGPGTPSPLGGMVPSGHIRLKATILSIDSLQADKIQDLNLYNAEIKIDSVEGFGAGAKAVMSGDILMLDIQTLVIPPSEDEEDRGDTLYVIPKTGQQFRGDVETIRSENGSYMFKMSKYIIQESRKP